MKTGMRFLAESYVKDSGEFWQTTFDTTTENIKIKVSALNSTVI